MASKEHPMFELWKWVLSNSGAYHTSLAGSAATPMSINDLINLSTDPETTKRNLAAINTIPLGLGRYDGDPGLRENIAAMYSDPAIGAGDVVVTNATTGANALVFQSLLRGGDHIVAMYPCYNQLLQFPAEIMGLEVSHWRLDPDDGWNLQIEDLKALIKKGKTEMLVLNNPHNPTGRVLSTAFQRQIVDVAREHDLIIFCDEIFRPLFHSQESRDTTSLVHHANPAGFDKIIVTGSLSKPYGLSGTRIGWAVTRSPELREKMIRLLPWTLSSVSVTDEVIAKEALSPRLRQGLLDITLKAARANLALLKEMVEGSTGRLDLVVPKGGGTGFVRILEPDRKSAVDDVEFCMKVRDREGVLLAPGSKTFAVDGGQSGDFRGFVRVHITAPVEMFRRGIEGVRKFLKEGGGEVENGGVK